MSRDAILAAIKAASAPPPKSETISGLGEVFVRVMTPYDSDLARAKLAKHDGAEDGCRIGRLLATILCDETGEPLYDVDNLDDVRMLSRLHRDVSDAVFKAHRAANGVVETKQEATDLGNG